MSQNLIVMIFNFQGFVHQLSEDTHKAQIVTEYERLYPGELSKPLEQQLWYIDYVSTFKTVPIAVPEEVKNDFDWNLLVRLAASSFSSDIKLIARKDATECDIRITVSNNGEHASKILSELWAFQIFRLYSVYIEENMQLQILIASDIREKEAILDQRKYRIELWNYRSLFIYENEKDIEAILQ